jgi:hypothetical protein
MALTGKHNIEEKFITKRLRANSEYLPHSTADQVTLLAIYIPLLRDRLKDYILDWNSHNIRPQKAPVVYGKVSDLYNRPGDRHIQDFKQYFEENDLLVIRAGLLQR